MIEQSIEDKKKAVESCCKNYVERTKALFELGVFDMEFVAKLLIEYKMFESQIALIASTPLPMYQNWFTFENGGIIIGRDEREGFVLPSDKNYWSPKK